jgi:hypothetical protein
MHVLDRQNSYQRGDQPQEGQARKGLAIGCFIGLRRKRGFLGCHGSSRRFEKDAVNPKADLLSLRNLTRFGSVGKSAVRIGNFPVIFIVLPGFS